MPRSIALRRWLFRLLKIPPRLVYAIGPGTAYGRFVLLLTTNGRKTGEPRITPLQYEQVNGNFVVASARGARADWYRNALADPRVEVRVGRSPFSGVAETCSDLRRIADFLELRLERHPRMVGRILRLRGVPANPTRSELETYASRLTMVTITPPETQRRRPPIAALTSGDGNGVGSASIEGSAASGTRSLPVEYLGETTV